jgi:triosephosphate isomerase
VTHRARKPYIAGNWKMNLDRSRSLDLIKTVKGRLGDGGDREVAFFVPVDLPRRRHRGRAGFAPRCRRPELLVRGQRRVHRRSLAPRMLREVGADRVLVGHSERRHIFHEPDEWMGARCGGARQRPAADLLHRRDARRAQGQQDRPRAEAPARERLREGPSAVDAHRVTVAYEPVWAIGTGETATSEQVATAHRTIRKWIVQRSARTAANLIRILYGGSVKPDNAKELMADRQRRRPARRRREPAGRHLPAHHRVREVITSPAR